MHMSAAFKARKSSSLTRRRTDKFRTQFFLSHKPKHFRMSLGNYFNVVCYVLLINREDTEKKNTYNSTKQE